MFVADTETRGSSLYEYRFLMMSAPSACRVNRAVHARFSSVMGGAASGGGAREGRPRLIPTLIALIYPSLIYPLLSLFKIEI